MGCGVVCVKNTGGGGGGGGGETLNAFSEINLRFQNPQAKRERGFKLMET